MATSVRAKSASNMSSDSSLQAMLPQVHGSDADDSDNPHSEDEMGTESDQSNESVNVSGEENDDLSEEEDEESASDEEVDSLADDAEMGDWMEVDDQDSGSNTSSSDEEPNEDTMFGKAQALGNTDPKLHGNAGWADAMAKILRTSKPKGKKSIVLAKAKKLSQVDISEKLEEKKENFGFEIDGEEPSEREVKPKVEDVDVKPDTSDSKFKVKRRDLLADGKVRPTILSRERERALNKIATKGVVQLFNAVRDQHRDISRKVKQARGSIRKEDKVIKSVNKHAFLDSLMDTALSERIEDYVQSNPKDVKIEKSENPATWDVLRDNFLTGSSMKDWDQHGEIKLEDDVDEVELN